MLNVQLVVMFLLYVRENCLANVTKCILPMSFLLYLSDVFSEFL